jgi:hypothetical protein
MTANGGAVMPQYARFHSEKLVNIVRANDSRGWGLSRSCEGGCLGLLEAGDPESAPRTPDTCRSTHLTSRNR